MWEVDQDLVMDIAHRGTRKVFAAIWKLMDATSKSKSQMVQVDGETVKDAFPRQVWWEALKELEDTHVIKRWRSGSMWTTVMVNPHVVRPWWMRGKDFEEAMSIFNAGPTIISKNKCGSDKE